jgi:hypothetical protein
MDVHLQFPRIQTGPVLAANMTGGTLTCWTSNNPVSIQIK